MNRTRLRKLTKHSVRPSRGFVALGPAFMLLLLGASCSKIDSETNARLDKVALSAIPPGQHKQVCGDVTADAARCYARVRTNSAGDVQALTTPSGLGPVALQSAYLAPTGGAGQTVAIVDAYDDPYAESELATYRSQFGLPPCTTANGCFKKVNQNGAQSPLPVADSGWAVEIALDLAMVSAICPSCNILLVEANSNSWSDLGTAVNSAAALAPAAISNSWGGSESSSSTTYDSQYFNHPGILITVSSGDYGYGVEYPASSKYVLSVGGTSLVTSTSSRGWAETVWNGAGSGCSAYIDKPSLQTDPGGSKRTVADVSAVADPNTGVAVYSTYEGGWLIVGGTSASSPIVAAIFAAAGKTAVGTIFPYTHTGAFYDVTTGGNGSCSPAYLCTGQVGFDGPTGWGTPNGQLIAASSDVAQVFSVTFNPSTLEGGSPSTGTILLTAFAPAGGAMVALTNSAPGLVTVSSSVVGAFSHRRSRRNDVERDRHAQWPSTDWRRRRVSVEQQCSGGHRPSHDEHSARGDQRYLYHHDIGANLLHVGDHFRGLPWAHPERGAGRDHDPGRVVDHCVPVAPRRGRKRNWIRLSQHRSPNGRRRRAVGEQQRSRHRTGERNRVRGSIECDLRDCDVLGNRTDGRNDLRDLPRGFDCDHDPHGLALAHATIGYAGPHFGYRRYSRDGDRAALRSRAGWRRRRDSHQQLRLGL